MLPSILPRSAINKVQPYDCGFFLTRSLSTLNSIFQNPNAAYLATSVSNIPSPHNIGLENSQRFRALPVYGVLLAHGRKGLEEMFVRQVRLARGIATFLDIHGEYELLANGQAASGDGFPFENTHVIVLFRAKDEVINSELVKRINATRKMYVSGTKWDGKPACRIAVSTWRVDVQRDLKLVSEVLMEVLGNNE
jgi:glutamate/tyrosine decarboxylase-like PLP-dependent enzyme